MLELFIVNTEACPTIYVVAVPIGNAKDMTPRAQQILSQVELIAAEDTRNTGKLLKLQEVKHKQLVSYHDHIEKEQSEVLIARMIKENISIALVSDAGTPCVADPGYRLIAKAHELGVRVVPVPGPSALTSIICSSGLPSDRVLFTGFLPNKVKALEAEVLSWQTLRASVVCYESAKRLKASLETMAKMIPNARIVIGRELTKTFEEIRQFSLTEALNWVKEHKHLKGEVTLMVHVPMNQESEEERLNQIKQEAMEKIAAGASHRDLLTYYSYINIEKRKLYRFLLDLRSK